MMVFVGLRRVDWVGGHTESGVRCVQMVRTLSWCGFWEDDGCCWGLLAEG